MKQMENGSFLHLIVNIITVILTFFPFSGARNNISLNQPLLDNETLISDDGTFALGFFTPGNSNHRYLGLWYSKISEQTILWVANRDNPLINSKGTLVMSSDGILAIRDENSTTVWAVRAFSALETTIVQLLDTGNLVVIRDHVDTPDSYVWQSFNYPADTLLPGMKLGVQFNTGYSWNLTSWASSSDPSSGKKILWMGISGYPEMYLSDTNVKEWRSGPWDGLRFNGIQDMDIHQYSDPNDIQYNFVNSNEEISYSYYKSSDTPSRLVVNESGFVQQLLWENNQWNMIWYEPKHSCDKIGTCGSNTICDSQNVHACSCLPGFTGNVSNGCTQKTELNCDYTDVFEIVSGVKLPKPWNVDIHAGLGFSNCRSLCLGSNCSCTAFALTNNDDYECMIWSSSISDVSSYNTTGQNLYIRVSNINEDLPKRPGNKIKRVAIIISFILGILLLAYVGRVLCRGKKVKNEIDGENEIELPIIDFETIATATDNFSAGNKLGEGGFGPVYKGKIEDDQEIAVKRLSKSSQQGVDEFKNEVQLIAKLQHRNLVRLLGCCIQKEERMLIYEYMPNKSLDTFLFGKEEEVFLDWKTRYNVIIGIARGVLYLHHDSRFRIIHRDLKASNILLDKDMDPKISDFGMARIFGGDETDINTRKIVGTYGYMSPEYALEGIFSMKSDIFSFGVLVLEIISGKKNRGVYTFSPHLNLLAHFWNLWTERDSLQLVDEKILNCSHHGEIIKCIKIGLLCVQERPENRPLMRYVIEMFSKDIDLLPEPNPPGFVTRIAPLDELNIQEQFSLNNVSITSLGGR